jgi:tellurite methyltransferase
VAPRGPAGSPLDPRPIASQPSAWLVSHEGALPRHGRALDLASGEGRHAVWLASRGLEVTAIDRDARALEAVQQRARASALPVSTMLLDLEQPGVSLDVAAFDVIVATHYLHRPLFPTIRGALKDGGLLIYETFTRAQASIGRPTNPAFLLDPGELERLVAPLEILSSREGFFEGRYLASVVARRHDVNRPGIPR